MKEQAAQPAPSDLPPGQRWAQEFIINAALDIPRLDDEKWHIQVTGLVGEPLEYSYDNDFLSLPMTKYVRSFSCLIPNRTVLANPEPIKMRARDDDNRP